MRVVSIYGGHNSSIVFQQANGNYKVIEFERLTKERYFMLADKSPVKFTEIVKAALQVASNHWGIENQFDVCAFGKNGDTHLSLLPSVINCSKIYQFDHHLSHAASAFYQSPASKLSPSKVSGARTLIVSFDGGGNDGVFNVYLAENGDLQKKPIFTSNLNLGHAYMLTAYPIEELKGRKGALLSDLALAGKLMGLVGYGKVRSDWVSPLLNFYKSTNRWSLAALGEEIGHDLSINALRGDLSFDFAATSQYVFEQLAFELLDAAVRSFKPDFLCLAGGCALNVLFNERLARDKRWGDSFLFVPPNPDDGGLALGQHFLTAPPASAIDVTFSGLPILDADNFPKYLALRKHKKVSIDELAHYIRKGKIIGVIEGESEVGPRALGNRSIICDPSFPNMKDILNSRVKFREWFRPFAPVALDKFADKYFALDQWPLKNHAFMSFAPLVREDYRSQLASITHHDGSSRLQVICSEGPDTLFKRLLQSLEKLDNSRPSVILNTSFNIKGRPILSTYADAFYVLDNTELDSVYSNGYLFE